MLFKNFKYIVIIVFLIIIIAVSLFYSCSNIVPYSSENNWYYKYEGMKDISENENKKDISNENTDELSEVIDPMTTQEMEDQLKKKGTNLKKNLNKKILDKTKTISDKNIKKSVEGFEGIFGTPLNTNEIIDVFSNTKSSVNCYGSGLTNSGGGLCLNDKQKQLLTTRGGNAGV
jgi:spore coat protein CotH